MNPNGKKNTLTRRSQRLLRIPHSRNIILVLAIANAANFIDRQLIFTLFPLIKDEFLPSDFQLGLLGTIFMLTHSIATVPFGILTDRWYKRKLITLGMVFWSFFTFVSGFAQRLVHLIVARGLIGAGGATFEPAAISLLTERVDESHRGRAIGFLRGGMWIGGCLGLMLGGILGASVGWRNTFFIAALPGFMLALFTWNIYEPPSLPPSAKTKRKTFDWNFLSIMIILAGVFANFTAGAYVAWIPTFLVRYDYFDLPTAAFLVGGPTIICGLLGVFVGCTIADKLFQKIRYGRILTVGIGMTVSTPFVLLGFNAPNSTVLVAAIALSAFFMAWYHGPIMAALMDCVSPSARGAMTGIYIFFIHMLGDMPSPAVLGWLSDHLNLRFALSIFVLGNVLCALCFFIAIVVGFKKKSS